MQKKLCLLFVFFSLHAKLTQAPPTYNTIQGLNLASLEWVDEDWPNESYHDYIMRCLEYQLNPHRAKKRRIIFKLFHKIAMQEEQSEHNALADTITAQDLQLFCGQKIGDAYLADIVCRTSTELGRIFLYGLIGNPSCDISVLNKRQKIIKTLVDSPEFYHHLSDAYSQIASVENILLSFWAQDGFLHTTKQRYFSIPYLSSINEYLNNSETALSIRTFIGHQNRALYCASGVFAAGLLPLYGISLLNNKEFPSPFDRIASHLQGSGGRLLGILSSTRNRALAGTATVVAGIYCALACKEDYEWAADNILLNTCVHKKMIGIARFFNALTHLKKTLDIYPLKDAHCAQKIATFFEDTLPSDPELSRLIDILETPTFQGEASFFANQGRVLLAFRLMYSIKEKLEPLLMALAELDASLSVASLYNEYKNHPNRFCFVTYETHTTPFISMRQFWNPFIDSAKVVANDLTLEGPTKRNMVITGPNAGGKSTLIKAIAINLILAQSLSITAAQEASITPFYCIGTYLNVVDNIAAGNSLFKAQVLRAQYMVDCVEKTSSLNASVASEPNLLSKHFSFIALDEMFNGTSAEESKAIAYSVAKHISRFENNICVLATHFPLLTKLADEHSAFENYKVSVDIDLSKGIHYPFKLEKGLSNQHIALDILREEGYACSIVDEALALLKHNNNEHKIDSLT